MAKYFLTTAIDYSNGDPHLGHALEKVGADAIARYRRIRGDQVHFLMGMDEHSQSVLQAAARAGVQPQEWVDTMARRFEEFWRRLECSNDDWIRTTEPRHVKIEKLAYATHAATAHEVSTLGDFRTLFSRDVLKRSSETSSVAPSALAIGSQ